MKALFQEMARALMSGMGVLATRVQAVFSVIDSRTRILETKLIVGCTDDDIETIMKYHNSYSQSAIMVKRKSEKDEI